MNDLKEMSEIQTISSVFINQYLQCKKGEKGIYIPIYEGGNWQEPQNYHPVAWIFHQQNTLNN